MRTRKQALAHIAGITCGCIWGYTYVAMAILFHNFTPVEVQFFRFALAALTLHLIYPKRMGKTTWRQELIFAAAGLTGVMMYFLLQGIAIVNTSASNVAVIVAINPMFTALLSWKLLGHARPGKIFFLGALLALCGIGLISFAGAQLELNPVGDVIAVFTALTWAFYCIFAKKVSEFGIRIILTTRRVFLYGLLFLIPVMIAMDFQLGLERFANPTNVANILYLGLAASAAAYILWNFAVERLGPARTSVYIYLIPLVGVVGSILVLGETLTWLRFSGITLTLGGLVLSRWKARQQTEVQQADQS